jgi:8-hydroxy-5-deazaflavin:NADPH oxidoreductase
MPIGITGAGAIGTALAQRLVAAGEQVLISNSRGPQTLEHLPSDLRLTAATVKGGRLQQFPGGPLPALDLLKEN